MIHKTAKIHTSAILGARVTVEANVEIGPFTVIEDDVFIEKGTRIMNSCTLGQYTRLGPNNLVYPYTTIGLPPQDLKFDFEETWTLIGENNVIREHCTFHRGTKHRKETRVGSHNLFMVGSHIAHDCIVGDHNIFANAATLAGHVTVGSHATVGAYSGVHQFCRVGKHAFIGGYSVVTQDALPYVKTVGNRASIYGINHIGLQRLGFTQEEVNNLKSAYRTLFHKKMRLKDALAELKEKFGTCPHVSYLAHFIENSERGITR